MDQKLSLDEMSIDELRAELAARQAKSDEALSPPASTALADFDDESIIQTLRAKQKVIYGVDDRVDVFLLTDPADLSDVDGVVALFRDTAVTDNGDGTSTLTTQNFGAARNLCANERFRNQPIGAFCSGFLVAPDIVATAGHCIDANNVTNVRFVFGFRMQNANTPQTTVNNTEIYSGVQIIGRQEVSTGPDWALVRIDRAVSNHRVLPVRRIGQVPNNQALHVIGHPSGLPIKFAGGATIRSNQSSSFFVANLDTYGGNSGSPVFNSTTREVEGILVRGESDFVQQGNCRVSLVCPTTGCRGEDCTRTTEFDHLLNPISTGNLLWYHHDGWLDGTERWDDRNIVGRGGWDQYKSVFASSDGVLYAISNDGNLYWYKHNGWQNGSENWAGRNIVGHGGWQQYKSVFASSDGVLYGIVP